MPDLSDAIEDAAESPKSATGPDGQSVTARDVKDLIAADKYLAEKASRTTGAWYGVRPFISRPGGAT